jgi:hypothetical protein
VPALDVIKDIRSRLGSGPVLPSVYPLAFEHAKETFGRRVVSTTADGAHAARDVVGRSEALVLV